MRILCAIPALGPGGAERVLVRLANHLVQRHEVIIVTWEGIECVPFYDLSPAVRSVRTGLLGGAGMLRAWRLLVRPWTIRRLVRRAAPDVVLSFMDTMNVIAVAACLGTGVPVIVSERVDPHHHRLPWPKSVLRLLAYLIADRVVVQTERIRAYFPRRLYKRIEILANPVPRPETRAVPDRPGVDGRWRLIGMGRLDPQKGFDVLIEAFAQLAPRFPAWDLVIFGEGVERDRLIARIAVLGLETRVRLAGLTHWPAEELAASHVMAFPSRYEGFPNALAEALAVGLPAVAFAGVSGVEELVLSGRGGWLADPALGAPGFAEALACLMADAAMRVRFGEAARNHVGDWEPAVIFGRWETLLRAVASAKN